MNILFVVAHPDDEALWIGGLLLALSKTKINSHLLCLSGAEDTGRCKDFISVCNKLSINYTIEEGKVAQQREGGIPEIVQRFESGLNNLGIKDVDLVLTHSPYGDEHMNTHHVQTYNMMRNICNNRAWNWGFFSYMTLPYYNLSPIVWEAKRDYGLHVVSCCECTERISTGWPVPKYYVQFRVSEEKHSLVNMYTSIDREEHRRGYYAWDSLIEGYYLYNENGFNVFKELIDGMNLPNHNPGMLKAHGHR